MGCRKIIRNVTTMDRGSAIRASTDDVLMAARRYGENFTTREIALVLGVDEYPVRVAISWLVRKGIVERCGRRHFFTKASHIKYFALVYRVKVEATEVDFSALNRAFGFA